METKEALEYYGGDARALADALGIWHSAIYQWGEHPPALRQLQLERITNGALKAEDGIFGDTKDGSSNA